VAPRSGEPGSAPERRFFLAGRPEAGRAELHGEDARHALRVLRLGVGDRLVGLDGHGGVWPMAIDSVDRDSVEVRQAGEGRIEPPYGAPGSVLPRIEISTAWPRGAAFEEMLDRLTQLGAAAIRELSCERAGPGRGPLTAARRERAERILREACKQSGRAWLPSLDAPEDARPAAVLLLDPEAELGLAGWAAGNRGVDGPVTVLVGPEGGFTPAEREAWLSRGAVPVRVGPHVLRIETAAEAAMAVLAAACLRPRRT